MRGIRSQVGTCQVTGAVLVERKINNLITNTRVKGEEKKTRCFQYKRRKTILRKHEKRKQIFLIFFSFRVTEFRGGRDNDGGKKNNSKTLN